ncbi:MAG: hypothetical protein ACYTKC_22885, partial [Planctomycetota bacterium]
DTAGDSSMATEECSASPGTSLTPGTPDPGRGRWFLVRPDESVNGTYESAGPGQLEGRDASIAASGLCP